MRAFIAIDVPLEIRQRLAAVQDELRPTAPSARWVAAESIHVTLKFIGEITDKRREDIPLLAAQCLDDVAGVDGQQKRTLAPEAVEALASAKWPGNVRQLRMVVKQVAALGAGPVITAEQVQEAQGQVKQLPSFDEARDEFTRNYLVQLLKLTDGNVADAARLAERNRTEFYRLLQKYDLDASLFRSDSSAVAGERQDETLKNQ